MGDVWLARNETLDIDVAVKLLRKEAEGPEAGSRFLREARAAARLGHPSIVRIFDFGIAEQGEPFIVMERLVGEDLATALQRRGRLPAIHAVRTLLPIAHALASAHAKGVIHRDLKPENVFLARGEGERLEPKVVDFGVAKLDLPMELQLTKDGMLLGSPAYMSPEQSQGVGVDHRADIWSLAVVLYETIAGLRPFDGKTHNATLISIGRDEPRPFTELSAGDDELWRIVAKGLRKDRRQRWDSMRSFGEALAAWAVARGATEDIAGCAIEATWRSPTPRDGDGLGVSLAPPPVRRDAVDTLRRAPVPRRRLPLYAAAAAAAVLLVLSAVFWKHGASDSSKTTSAAPASENEKPATTSRPATEPAPAPKPADTAPVAPASGAGHRKAAHSMPVKSLAQIPVDGRPAAGSKHPGAAKTKNAPKVSLREH
jgi:serine/threonine-protein kinase